MSDESDILSNADSREEIKEIMAACYRDYRILGKTIFPESFYMPFSGIHDKVFDLLQNGGQKIAIAANRGFGKTTIDNLLVPSRDILFQDRKFIVPISNTNSQALLQSENLKRELLTNPNIKKLFGPMKSDWFTKEMWVTAGGTAVFPRGAEQQVRGVKYNNYRPDLIILDDLEDAEAVRNEDRRKKLKEWFFADVLNSVNRNDPNWRVIFVGTILHEDSLLENILNDPTWDTLRLEICDDNYKSNWPALMSDEAVKALADAYKAQGMLDVFYREYRNIPISTEDATFRQEYFRYFSVGDKEFQDIKNKLEVVILVDPAKTVKIHSAETAIIAAGLDMKSGRIYVLDYVGERLYPNEIYDNILMMAAKYKAVAIGIEVTSLHEFITFPFKNEMVRRGEVYPLIELSATGKKEDRIAALVPFYRSGLIFHNKDHCDQLEAQLLPFPRPKRFDLIDALAYIIKLMDIGDRFFDSAEPDEEEYDELYENDDMPTLANWRLA